MVLHLACSAERGGDEGILASRLTGGATGGGAEVQVARSSWALPTFQHVTLPAAGAADQPASITLTPQQASDGICLKICLDCSIIRSQMAGASTLGALTAA